MSHYIVEEKGFYKDSLGDVEMLEGSFTAAGIF
jgi:hypothetical protein